MEPERDDCFVVEGKLALPYQYFAGRTGSRFLVRLRDDRTIMGMRCQTCDKVFVPPRSTCDVCMADLTGSWVDLKNTGTITGFTIVRYKEPHQPLDPPYAVALIKLDGADTPLAHVVQSVALDKVEVGMRVEAVFAEKSCATIREIDHFRPL